MSDSTHPHKSPKDSANALDRLDKIGSAFESFNSAESTAKARNDDISLSDLNKPLSPGHKSSSTSPSESDFSSSFELDKGLKDLAKIASLSARDSKAADSKKNTSSLSDLEDLIESVDATDQDQDADSLEERDQEDRVHEAKNLPKVDVASEMASKVDLQSEIAALRKQVLDLTKLSGVIKIDDEAYLNSFDDTIAIDHLKNQRLSICVVAGAGLDTHLIRIADLKANGLFEAFHKTSASEDSVESIDKIRLADSTVSKGTVGVWSWAISKKATSNHKKGPYSTVSRPQNLIVPTEVVILQDIHSLDELILKIKDGL